MIVEVLSEEEMLELAVSLASRIKLGTVLALEGDLGVGKTVFAKGFAKGLGIDEDITSPTFTIVNTYKTPTLTYNHFDVYRIEDIDELYEIGFNEYIDASTSISLIEWASLIEEALPKEIIRIIIEKNLEKNENYRKVIIEGGDYDSFSN